MEKRGVAAESGTNIDSSTGIAFQNDSSESKFTEFKDFQNSINSLIPKIRVQTTDKFVLSTRFFNCQTHKQYPKQIC